MCYYIISLLLRRGSSIIFFRRLRTKCKLSRLPVKINWWSFHSLLENDVKITYTKNQINRKIITWATFINACTFSGNLAIKSDTRLYIINGVCRTHHYGDTKNDTSYIMCQTSFKIIAIALVYCEICCKMSRSSISTLGYFDAWS